MNKLTTSSLLKRAVREHGRALVKKKKSQENFIATNSAVERAEIEVRRLAGLLLEERVGPTIMKHLVIHPRS